MSKYLTYQTIYGRLAEKYFLLAYIAYVVEVRHKSIFYKIQQTVGHTFVMSNITLTGFNMFFLFEISFIVSNDIDTFSAL